MISPSSLKKLALSFPESEARPHFEKTSFRVHKKIFATLSEDGRQCVVKLSQVDQSVFCDCNPAVMYPVKGVWGKQGWTIIELKKVKKGVFTDALTTAYFTVAPEKLAKLVRPDI